MRVAIIGSRGFEDLDLLKTKIKELDLHITEIVSGGAKGTDQLAERFAELNDLPIRIFLPDFKKYARGAYWERNRRIIDYADFYIAFWDGRSKGTKYTIDYARKMNINGEIILI